VDELAAVDASVGVSVGAEELFQAITSPDVLLGVIADALDLAGRNRPRPGVSSELLRTFLPRKMRFERSSLPLLRATLFQTQCFLGSNAVLNLIDWEVPTASNPTALRNPERQNSGPELENGPPKSRRVI
jgi:hypothetical protein